VPGGGGWIALDNVHIHIRIYLICQCSYDAGTSYQPVPAEAFAGGRV
jgi:hypothetical protein